MSSYQSPELLLDGFKAAALSVTKLFKLAAAAEAKSRTDGYQECLEELLGFLDSNNIGLGQGEGVSVRKWIAERVDPRRDTSPPQGDSDEDVYKNDPPIQESRRPSSAPITAVPAITADKQASSRSIPASADLDSDIVVPTRDTFTFQTPHPYPQDTTLSVANLALSDLRSHDSPAIAHTPRSSRTRGAPRSGGRTSGHLGKGAGSKRKVNLADFFDLSSISSGDFFNLGSMGGAKKRQRHS